jgi:hypothetical protein
VRRLLYNLPEVIEAVNAGEIIFIPEGEEDSNTLRRLGLVATTNSEGAGKWPDHLAEDLQGARVVILPDNDAQGRGHATKVIRSVFPVAAWLKRLELPGLTEKGDVSDWLKAGHTKEELLALVEQAPVMTAEEVSALAAEEEGEDPENDEPDNPWRHGKPAPEYLAEEEQAFEGLAKDFLAPGAITEIAAPRGLGKTQVAMSIAVTLAKGGTFRGEPVKPAKVYLIDRDNPRAIIKQRLRAWGADEAPNLTVLDREHAPDLKDRKAWEQFPLADYSVLVIDAIGSSTEGITEKEGKQTTEVIGTIVDLARRGLAILLLQNAVKDGSQARGRGEWADRVDVIYEARDATDFIPSGTKSWWEELPDAGEAAWAARAARRKGRTDFRLAFIPSKYRIGPWPDPFCLEIRLPEGARWSLEDVTDKLLQSGEEAKAGQRRRSSTSSTRPPRR